MPTAQAKVLFTILSSFFFYNYFVILITGHLKRVTTIVPVICPLQEMKKNAFNLF